VVLLFDSYVLFSEFRHPSKGKAPKTNAHALHCVPHVEDLFCSICFSRELACSETPPPFSPRMALSPRLKAAFSPFMPMSDGFVFFTQASEEVFQKN